MNKSKSQQKIKFEQITFSNTWKVGNICTVISTQSFTTHTQRLFLTALFSTKKQACKPRGYVSLKQEYAQF